MENNRFISRRGKGRFNTNTDERTMYWDLRRENKIPKEIYYSLFFKIIKEIHEVFRNTLLEGECVIFPCAMGRLSPVVYELPLAMKNGKVDESKLSIVWKDTIELWKKDEEAFRDKLYVRRIYKEGVDIVYIRSGARYNNKGFFSLEPSRTLIRTLYHRYINNEVYIFGDRKDV